MSKKLPAINFVREFLNIYYKVALSRKFKWDDYLEDLAEKAREVIDQEDRRIVQEYLKRKRKELGLK